MQITWEELTQLLRDHEEPYKNTLEVFQSELTEAQKRIKDLEWQLRGAEKELLKDESFRARVAELESRIRGYEEDTAVMSDECIRLQKEKAELEEELNMHHASQPKWTHVRIEKYRQMEIDAELGRLVRAMPQAQLLTRCGDMGWQSASGICNLSDSKPYTSPEEALLAAGICKPASEGQETPNKPMSEEEFSPEKWTERPPKSCKAYDEEVRGIATRNSCRTCLPGCGCSYEHLRTSEETWEESVKD